MNAWDYDRKQKRLRATVQGRAAAVGGAAALRLVTRTSSASGRERPRGCAPRSRGAQEQGAEAGERGNDALARRVGIVGALEVGGGRLELVDEPRHGAMVALELVDHRFELGVNATDHREDRSVLEPVVGLDEAAVPQAAEAQLPEDASTTSARPPAHGSPRERRRPPRPRRAGSRGRDRAGSSRARRAARRRAGCLTRAGLWRAVPQPPATPRSRLSPWSVRIRTDTAGRSRDRRC